VNPERETARTDPRIERIVAALQAPATADELAEENYYLRLYDSVGPRPGKSLRPIVIGGRAAVVAVIGVVTMAGVAAAHSGALPGPLQFGTHHATAGHRPASTADRSPETAAATVAARSAGAAPPGASTSSTDPRGPSGRPPVHPHTTLRPKPAKQTHGKTKKAAPAHPSKPSKPGKGHGKGKPVGHHHPTKAAL
jgi:hypothetical protein